ncbi:MAG: hypothetical protein JWQ98_451 [Chlorobi bacterium]|nr:hypothetical protein [Chlorobiota bacterium]
MPIYSPRQRTIRRYAPIILMLLLLGSARLPAQRPYYPDQPLPDDLALPLIPIHGLSDTVFFIGGEMATNSTSGSVGDLWKFARSLGLNAMEFRGNNPVALVDTLLMGRATRPNERLMSWIDRFSGESGWGRQVTFFPFDAYESYYWQCRFLTLSGGMIERNPIERYQGARALEQVYDKSNTTPGATVAQQAVFGHDSLQVYRWPGRGRYDSTQNGETILHLPRGDWGTKSYFIAVTGHLFANAGGGAADTDTLLAVDIWNEVPNRTTCRLAGSAIHTARRDTAYLYTSVYVRKSDLKPDTAHGSPDFDRYRSPVFPINLVRDPVTGIAGPASGDNSAHRFDIRIRWIGGEKLALRSIAVRDTLGQLMLGDDSGSVAYRRQLVKAARRLYYGTATPGPTTRPRTNIPLAYFGDEPLFSEYAGFNAIDRLLRDSTAPGGDTTRSLRPHYELNQVTLHKALISNAATVEPGFYPTSAGWAYNAVKFGFDTSFKQPPVLAMHDGGVWNVPRLGETADSVELYEKVYQRATIGQYNTGRSIYPYQYDKLTDLGYAARAASRTGRWLIPWIGEHGQVNIKWFKIGDSIQARPDMQWILEAAQLRLICNLALCYGARGVHYAWVGSDTDEVMNDAAPIDEGHTTLFGSNWGPVGFFTDRTADRVSPFTVRTGMNQTATLPSFYTGWGVRLREMQWLDTVWFPSVGREMLKLRWRDGYSIHFTVPQSYMTDPGVTISRPLPSTEIVNAVRSWKPAVGGNAVYRDPDSLTYVELGLFNRKRGADTSRHQYDTNYLFVVNRRTFERPDDTSATSDYGRKLDTLAETRTISLTLNMPHPDGDPSNYIHIREVFPDTARLALTSAPRVGLDTIVRGDRAVEITLRPGGGALLELTYRRPTSDRDDGDIRHRDHLPIPFVGNRRYAAHFHAANNP